MTMSTHPCPIEACEAQVAAHLAMCSAHWEQIPGELRAKVTHSVRRQDEKKWAKALRSAIEHVNALAVAPTCPYCSSPARLADSTEIYGRRFGWVYACSRWPECDAYVGCHKGTRIPLGRLADKALRTAKSDAHAAFDPLWRAKVELGHSRREARAAAYAWLARELGIPVRECHIGSFDLETCRRVIELCVPWRQKVLPASERFAEGGGQ